MLQIPLLFNASMLNFYMSPNVIIFFVIVVVVVIVVFIIYLVTGVTVVNRSSSDMRKYQSGSLSNLQWRTTAHGKKRLVCFFLPSASLFSCRSFDRKFSQICVVVVVDIQLLAGLMWSNTVIVCKGKMAAELDMDVQVEVVFWRVLIFCSY